MAWVYEGHRGTNTAKTAGANLTISPNQDVPVGAVLVLWVAWDNNNNLTATGPLGAVAANGGPQFRVTDSLGIGVNRWATIFEAQDNGQTARCHAGIFICQVMQEIQTTDVITITHGVSGSWVAKACVLEEFSLPSGYAWANANATHLHTRAADPGSISSAGGMANREWLWLYALAAEGPSTDTYTWDSDYTQLTNAGTTGGTDDSNMTINPGYRIATGSGDTVDVTSDTADRDYTQGLVGVAAFIVGDPFPSPDPGASSDDFNRADVSPIDGNWDQTDTLSPANATMLQIVSNQVRNQGSIEGGQIYERIFIDSDGGHEVYATLSVAPTGAVDNAGVVTNAPDGVGGHDPGLGNDADGYALYMTSPTGLWYGSGQIDLDGPFGYGWIGASSNGWKIGIRRKDGVSAIWVDMGSGWEYSGLAMASSFWARGRPGLLARQTARLDDFGCGGYVPKTPQIYRTVYAEVV